jgi:hypothetical protein
MIGLEEQPMPVKIRRTFETPVGTACIPLVLGVTGHRDLRKEDLPELERRVRDLIGQLRNDYPHTVLQLLSPLAEGADRLVARVALESDVELFVPLPLPQEEYERDFPKSVGEFKTLLERATAVFNLPAVVRGTSESIRENDQAHNQRYEEVGVFIVRHCHILIALWDGSDPDQPAGTAAIVEFKLRGVPRHYAPEAGFLDPPDIGPVYQILTRRQTPSADSRRDEPPRWLFPEDTEADYFASLYRSIDRFNADASKLATERGLRVAAQSANQLLGNSNSLGNREKVQVRLYTAADILSKRFQRRAKWMMGSIFVSAMFMVLSMEFYLDYKRPGIIAYLLLFIFAASLATIQRRLGYQNRYLDYRALAEGLRVQLFWDLAGLSETAADHYLSKQSDELQWVREALRAMSLLPPKETASLDLVRDRWIKAEATYYDECVRRDQHLLKVMRRISNSLWALGLLLATGTAVLSYAVPAHHLPTPLVLVLVMTVAPGLAALWMSYAEKMAFDEQARQYARMALLFRRAENAVAILRQRIDDQELLHLLRELGIEALIENGDWVLLHRGRPIDLPRG